MATPYLQNKFETVSSTQDMAKRLADRLPLAVIAERQLRGRGRTGRTWLTAPRAVAVSVAIPQRIADRPISLLAGVAVERSIPMGIELKWPNDVMVDDSKVGGILVEAGEWGLVIGLGLNLWWPSPPSYAGGIFETDPGRSAGDEIASLWVAEVMRLLSQTGWPRQEYLKLCSTVGQWIVWEGGAPTFIHDVDQQGRLLGTRGGSEVVIGSGEVRHVRPSQGPTPLPPEASQ